MSRMTGPQAALKIEAEAATYGVIRSTDVTGRPRYEVVCGDCGKQSNTFISTINHADQLLGHFRKQGWTLNYKQHPYCSTQCIRHAKQLQREEQIEVTPKQAAELQAHLPLQTTPMIPLQTTPMIGPDPKIVRRVITLLNENFDTDKRLYADGWNDARIAKEADAALDFVISYRRRAYGELAEDPEATKLRTAIKALEDRLFAISAEIDELKARLDRFTGIHHKAQG